MLPYARTPVRFQGVISVQRYLGRIIQHRIRELRAALTSLPTIGGWRCFLLYYLAFVLCALLFGFGSGLLRWEPVQASPGAICPFALALLVRPALVEEIVFRGLLLPREHKTIPRGRMLTICSAALCLFVASHIVNGLFFRHSAVALFTDPRFLLIAAMMGAMCIASYLTTVSLWPGIAGHWLTVATWVLLLGGRSLLGARIGAAAAGP